MSFACQIAEAKGKNSIRKLQVAFVGFGAPASLGGRVFRMTVRPSENQAILLEDYGNLVDGIDDFNPERPRAILPLDVWNQVEAFVAVEFNQQLRDQRLPKGSWKKAGEVVMDPRLGRELALLWWAIEGLKAEDRAAIGRALRTWKSFRPEERWWFAGQAVENNAGSPDDGAKGWRRAIRAALVEG